MTWVIAHRGASRIRPENTFAAFDAALSLGCDAIELDVQLSRDGVPVVYHDRTLSRAGGGRRRVSQLTVAELKQLKAGLRGDPLFHNQRIPTLREVLNRYARRTRLLVEIKTREGRNGHARHMELARLTAEMLDRKSWRERMFVLSFDVTVLAECAAAAPQVRRVINLRAGRQPTRQLQRLLSDLAAVSVDIRTLTPRFANAIHQARVPLMAFTCNTTAKVRQALECGVMGIMADRPEWLAEQLQRQCA